MNKNVYNYFLIDGVINLPHTSYYGVDEILLAKINSLIESEEFVTIKNSYNKTIIFFKNGELHREDGPAVIKRNSIEYYVNGQLHREDGPAVIKYYEELWYKNGELHRENGPAIIRSNGYEVWYKNGQLHREDGPAIDNPYYDNFESQYYINGKNYSEKGYKFITGS